MNKLDDSQVNRLITLLLGTICILLVSGLAYYLYLNLEEISEEIDEGYTEEARRNPYLAAETFLKQSGLNAFTQKGLEKLDNLPSSDDTLIIFSSRMVLSERRNKELLDWIEQGGHLITTSQAFYNSETDSSGDRFLDHFGLQRYLTEDLKNQTETEVDPTPQKNLDATTEYTEENILDDTSNTKDEPRAPAPAPSFIDPPDNTPRYADMKECTLKRREDRSAACNDVVDEALTQITFGIKDDPVHVYLGTAHHIYDSTENATAQAGSAVATHLIQYHSGEGLITILTSDTLWKNSYINLFDHAYLLWLLMGDSETVWILYDVNIDHWLILLSQNAPAFLFSFLVLTFLWIWYRTYRFGPVISNRQFARRELMEHMEASARFHWHNKLQHKLTLTLRDDILQRASERQANFSKLDNSTQETLISRWTGIDAESLHQLIRNTPPTKETEFVTYCQHLQALRNRL
ncbi:MAG: DUF4350 domain-containing protein [Pseudomonadales bacterium]|nr:DUF4350 domain-containing protein [Pseudomonadales bacterium]